MTAATLVDDWRADALCRKAPEIWTIRKPESVKVALHGCRVHCPVLSQCRADAESLTPPYRHSVVLGGVAYGHHGYPASCQRERPCTACRILVRDLHSAARNGF